MKFMFRFSGSDNLQRVSIRILQAALKLEFSADGKIKCY